MKNIPPLYKLSLKVEGGTNSVNRKCNPLPRSCVWSARNAGESVICSVRAQPSAEIMRVERTKCRRECDLSGARATLCGDRACRGREMQARVRFGFVRQPSAEIVRVEGAKCRRECVLETCRFTLEEVSYETLVLETWRLTFGGSLARSARFGDLALHFWRESRTKRSFW